MFSFFELLRSKESQVWNFVTPTFRENVYLNVMKNVFFFFVGFFWKIDHGKYNHRWIHLEIDDFCFEMVWEWFMFFELTNGSTNANSLFDCFKRKNLMLMLIYWLCWNYWLETFQWKEKPETDTNINGWEKKFIMTLQKSLRAWNATIELQFSWF